MRIVGSALTILLTTFVVVACQSSQDQQQPQQPQPQQQQQQQQQQSQPPPQQGACGIQIFNTPACQQAFEQVCCPIAQECAKDANCARLFQCHKACRNPSAREEDNCRNACAMQSRQAYCQGACQGQNADCMTVCYQRGHPAEPLMKFAMIASCSKDVRYPTTCNDKT